MTRRSAWALLLAAVAVFPAFAASQTKRYIVGFDPRLSARERRQALKAMGGKEVDQLDAFSALVVEMPEAPLTVLETEAFSQPGVENMEEDVYVNWLEDVVPMESASFQASPLPALGEFLRDFPAVPQGVGASAAALPPGVDPAEVPWGIARVHAPQAWATNQGSGVRVAVLDTGIDSTHPDLQGQVVGCYNAFDSSQGCLDDNRHGTHVAGIIAALWNGRGVVGVAPKAKLLAVKVLDKKGGANLSSVIKGIVWCAKNNISVANMSLGSPMGSIFMRMALNYAADQGVTFVVAAGNSGKRVEYPAGYPGVIAVSASDFSNHIAKFSSRGDKVEFIAPGVDVNSTIPGGGYEALSGTSMAAPHVTGLAALAVAQGAHGINAVRRALTAAARPIGLTPAEQGRGLVDAVVLAQ